MTMSFDTALSGVNAASTDLSVIGNNVANSNTVGFKFSRAEFADLYTATLKTASSAQAGAGVKVTDIAQQFTQGTATTTNNNMDLAISGGAFFRVTDKNSLNPLYTRDGAFHLNNTNYIVNAQGQYLSSTGQAPILVDQGDYPASATATVSAAMNLNAAEVAPVATSSVNLTNLRLNAQDPVPPAFPFSTTNANSYNFKNSTTIYDTAGIPHSVTMYFAKANDAQDGLTWSPPNAWDTHVVIDGHEVYPGAAGIGTAPGRIVFAPAVNAADNLVSGAPCVCQSTIPWSLAYEYGVGSAPLNFSLNGVVNGATQSSITLDTKQALPGNPFPAPSGTDALGSPFYPVGSLPSDTDPSSYSAAFDLPKLITDSNGVAHTAHLYFVSNGLSTNSWTLHTLVDEVNSSGLVVGAQEVFPNGTTTPAQISVDSQGIFSTQPASFQYTLLNPGGGASALNFSIPELNNNGDISPTITQDGNAGTTWVTPANGKLPSTNPPTYDYTTSTTIYDSQGNPQLASLYFVKTGINTWDVHTFVGSAPNAQELTNSNNTKGVSLTFNTNGALIGTVPAPVPPYTSGQFTLVGPVTANGTSAINAQSNPVTFTMDLSKSTQFGSPYSVSSLTQDGCSSGQITGINIGTDGSVMSTFSNGKTRNNGQVALVDFPSVQGLTPVGNTEWAQSTASGAPIPATGSTVQAGALEGSNVDLTAQLVKMIVSQRNFQSNAQVISAVDTLLQTIVNLR